MRYVWFQKISIPTPRKIIGNSEGEGDLKDKKEKKANLEFPKGWQGGCKPKNPPHGGSMMRLDGYFLEPCNVIIISDLDLSYSILLIVLLSHNF